MHESLSSTLALTGHRLKTNRSPLAEKGISSQDKQKGDEKEVLKKTGNPFILFKENHRGDGAEASPPPVDRLHNIHIKKSVFKQSGKLEL